MLSTSLLTKSFDKPPRDAVLAQEGPGRGRTALYQVSLNVGEGRILCLVGPNGSGKTTLLKLLAGSMLPDKGEVLLAGISPAERPREAAELTGFSPGEERSFYGRLSILENLRFFASLRGMDEASLQARLRELEPALRLEESLRVVYQQAAAGVKQRLSVARALLHRPRVLLLDEPTKSLDPEAAGRLAGLVRREYLGAPGRVTVWSTHRPEEAWEAATDIALLDRGRLSAFGSPAELQAGAGAASPIETYLALTSRFPAARP